MIASIQHKGLRLYYENGDGSKLPADQLRKIARLFDMLEAVSSVEDISQLGSGIHKLKGNLSEYWSLHVSANYRLIFRFQAGDVHDVDYLDYH